MSVQDERMAILKMVEEGKITAQEAMELMEAIKTPESQNAGQHGQSNQGATLSANNSNRMLRIRVREGNDKTKVNVNIPLQLVKIGLDIAKNINVGEHKDLLNKIDMDEVIRLIDQGAQGKIVEVEDIEDQTFVEIIVD